LQLKKQNLYQKYLKKKESNSSDKVLTVAFKFYGKLAQSKISEKRKENTFKIMQDLDDEKEKNNIEELCQLYPRMKYKDIVKLEKRFNEILDSKDQLIINLNQFKMICLDLFPHIKREVLSTDKESSDEVLDFLGHLFWFGHQKTSEEMNFNNFLNIIHTTKYGTLLDQYLLCVNLTAKEILNKDEFFFVLKHLFLISFEGELILDTKKKEHDAHLC